MKNKAKITLLISLIIFIVIIGLVGSYGYRNYRNSVDSRELGDIQKQKIKSVLTDELSDYDSYISSTIDVTTNNVSNNVNYLDLQSNINIKINEKTITFTMDTIYDYKGFKYIMDEEATKSLSSKSIEDGMNKVKECANNYKQEYEEKEKVKLKLDSYSDKEKKAIELAKKEIAKKVNDNSINFNDSSISITNYNSYDENYKDGYLVGISFTKGSLEYYSHASILFNKKNTNKYKCVSCSASQF